MLNLSGAQHAKDLSVVSGQLKRTLMSTRNLQEASSLVLERSSLQKTEEAAKDGNWADAQDKANNALMTAGGVACGIAMCLPPVGPFVAIAIAAVMLIVALLNAWSVKEQKDGVAKTQHEASELKLEGDTDGSQARRLDDRIRTENEDIQAAREATRERIRRSYDAAHEQ